MSENPESAAIQAGGGFDPERFFQMARSVGHGRALGLEYRQSADNWIELALPWREELVGIPPDALKAILTQEAFRIRASLPPARSSACSIRAAGHRYGWRLAISSRS